MTTLRRFCIALCATLTVLSGCASITTGQTQSVSVETPHCPAASCRLTNKDGTYFVPSTPGTVSVDRACGKLSVQCSKEGSNDYVMVVSSSVKAMAFGNILFGGIIGAGVDAATGAACEYPSLIPVPLSCGNAETVVASASSTPVPQHIIDTVIDMKCRNPVFVARAQTGDDVYTAACESNDIILSCGADKCVVNEVEQ